MVTTVGISECIICGKILGADSRDLGFIVCHDHRLCQICNEPVSPEEARFCAKKLDAESNGEAGPTDFSHLFVFHSDCYAKAHSHELAETTVNQTFLDYLNLIRLMIEPDPRVSIETNVQTAELQSQRFIASLDTYEKKVIYVRMMEAVFTSAKIVLFKEPQYRKADKDLEQKQKQFDKPKKSVKSSPTGIESPRPTKKIQEELQLEHFMEVHGYKPEEKEEALKTMKDFNRSVTGLINSAHLSEADAMEEATRYLLISKRIRK